MKKLALIVLTTVFGLVSAASFAADAPTPPPIKSESKAPGKSTTIHKGHLKHKAASSPMQKAQSTKPSHYKKHHHKKHHQHKPTK